MVPLLKTIEAEVAPELAEPRRKRAKECSIEVEAEPQSEWGHMITMSVPPSLEENWQKMLDNAQALLQDVNYEMQPMQLLPSPCQDLHAYQQPI